MRTGKRPWKSRVCFCIKGIALFNSGIAHIGAADTRFVVPIFGRFKLFAGGDFPASRSWAFQGDLHHFVDVGREHSS